MTDRRTAAIAALKAELIPEVEAILMGREPPAPAPRAAPMRSNGVGVGFLAGRRPPVAAPTPQAAPPAAVAAPAPVVTPDYGRRPSRANVAAQARAFGFTGDMCRDCGGSKMVRNGTCLKCNDCGSTTGCS